MFSETSESSLIFTKLVGFYLFFIKSLNRLYNSDCKHCITHDFLNSFSVCRSFFTLSLTASSTHFINGLVWGGSSGFQHFSSVQKRPGTGRRSLRGRAGARWVHHPVSGISSGWGFPLSKDGASLVGIQNLNHSHTKKSARGLRQDIQSRSNRGELSNQIIFSCCFLVLGWLVLI